MFSTCFEVIAGPCAVESQGQMESTIKQLPDNIKYVRGGIWKPRTSANMFEGHGAGPAFEWLCYTAIKYGKFPILEISTVSQLKQYIEFLDIKINNQCPLLFWIGARSSGDPFAVAEIASYIKTASYFKTISRNDIFIFVKNPIVEDEALWIGAVERLYNTGINGIGLIYRGTFKHKNKVSDIKIIDEDKIIQFPIINDNIFYKKRDIEQNDKIPEMKILESYEKELNEFRNYYNPEFALSVQKHLGGKINLFLDPSHIVGDNKRIKDFCLNEYKKHIYNGFIIETHCNPEEAITDRNQQITPKVLSKIIKSI